MTDSEALQHYRRGVSAASIAAAWGISRQGAMHRMQRESLRAGIAWSDVCNDRSVSTTRLSPEVVQDVLRQHRLGVSQRRIAQNLQINRITVGRIIRALQCMLVKAETT
jgi:DNA invertase Pin-like site-specific DNA recombinase